MWQNSLFLDEITHVQLKIIWFSANATVQFMQLFPSLDVLTDGFMGSWCAQAQPFFPTLTPTSNPLPLVGFPYTFFQFQEFFIFFPATA